MTRSGGEAGPSAPRFEPDGHGGVTVVVDGQPQSHVDLADPGLVTFEYVQHFCLALGPGSPPLLVTPMVVAPRRRASPKR